MTIDQIRKAMIMELDFEALEFLHYKEPHVKLNVSQDFRVMTKHYNSLLKNLYKKEGEGMKFPNDIIKYIQQRKSENWNMVG